MGLKNTINIYTDGACKGNPGPGGWGAVLEVGNKCRCVGGREDLTTNNRMELRAALEALRQINAYSGERERPFWLNVNTLFLNASPTGVCTPGVHVQSIS